MRTADRVRSLIEDERLEDILEGQSAGLVWRSTAAEARPLLFAARYLAHPTKTLIVTSGYERALAWQAKLALCGVPPERIHQLPSGSSSLFEDAAPEHIALSDRLGSLRALVEDGPNIVIAAPQAALERSLPREVLIESHLEIRPGDTIDLDRFLRSLTSLGYEPQEPVRIPGQYAQRGGILDIFPTGKDAPYRIELFGDEVESIRTFDPNTQRSIGAAPALTLTPSRETLLPAETNDLRDLLLSTAEREASVLDEEAAERLQALVGEDADAIAARIYFDRLDLYRPLLHPDSSCAVDLIDEDGLLVLDEPLEIESIAARNAEELGQALEARANRGEILQSPPGDFILPPEHLGHHPRTLSLTSMNALPDWLEAAKTVDVDAISLEAYRGRAENLTLTLRNYLREGFELLITTDQPNRARTVLSQAEIFVTESLETDPDALGAQALLLTGNLGAGFVSPTRKMAVVTDGELFGVARLKLPQKRFMEGAPIATVLDLKPGDYVVHINFGIGVFRGLVKRSVDGVEKEFLFVEYQVPDKLFVPADQLDRIQKYLNPGDENPKLNKLTGGEWQRTLGKAKEEAKAFARDLVKLYAERHRSQRRPYGPDSPFQDEMEGTFPWVETPSQLTAIRDMKKDMEEGYPMDRLVCGDVGFGKTEVAIRGAFKAVQAGRQVAVLCPTTILAEQHYRNFEERLGPFGTKLVLLNRYTSPAEKRDAIAGLKSGQIEIVVGTSALLGKSIDFHDLGLAVIDEEQKFGVKQKEALKSLRSEVDVLTLSATPIPRTLSMALMDIRQMSLINDPPPGRLPIRTYVRPYAGEVVREAILREMARGGQIFYVYNRVESIYHVEEKLRKLVPTARIGVAHGQMKEGEIEPIMVGFVKGEIDILLSTTIVENGIDISNANTLIVEQADRLGLSQLYQLRGRVGRSDRQAYAYFLYSGNLDASFIRRAEGMPEQRQELKKKYKTMTEGAMARLQALQEFSNLGSGYSLAFRDLQIRGAGELLGAKQSGTMVSVGYELYTQLIQEAVTQLKNTVDGAPATDADDVLDPLESLTPLPAFEVPVIALLPEAYIKDQSQRLYYYQRMMSARDEIILGAVEAEVEDRYGRPPKEVANAFAIMSLRIRAKRLGWDKVDARNAEIRIVFRHRDGYNPRVFNLLAKRNRDMKLTRDYLLWPYEGAPIRAVESLIDQFSRAMEEVDSDRGTLAGARA
ncbi:transcription-repair coupling factor [soil metagenome]